MSIGVVVATFGDWDWIERGERALADLEYQTRLPDAAVHVHGTTLAAARNHGAAKVDTDWLVFLDADDGLDQHYLEAMTAAAPDQNALLQPATLGVYPDGSTDDAAVLIPRRNLIDGNFMVIGTAVRRGQFLRLGGFGEWLAWEDWELWLRCWCDGAELVAVPDAVYRVGVGSGTRNAVTQPQAGQLFSAIRGRHTDAARARVSTAAAGAPR